MMDVPRSPDPVSSDRPELLPPAVGMPASSRLRAYTDEQIQEFERADILDGEGLRVARQFDLATGGDFFYDRTPDARSTQSDIRRSPE
jgi:hypothetical protein